MSEEIKCTGCGGEFARKDVAFVPAYDSDGSMYRPDAVIISNMPFCWKCLMKWRGISYREGKPEATFKR